jgi:hypothetical protein
MSKRRAIEFPTTGSMHRWIEDNVLPTEDEINELRHLFATSPFGRRRAEKEE